MKQSYRILGLCRESASYEGFPVRFGINLRGDLAKLDLRDLEERMDRLFEERAALFPTIDDMMFGERTFYQKGWAMPFGRGPFHARPFYKLQAFFLDCSGRRGLGRLHVIDCELKDLLDELRRRKSEADRVAIG